MMLFGIVATIFMVVAGAVVLFTMIARGAKAASRLHARKRACLRVGTQDGASHLRAPTRARTTRKERYDG